MHYWIQRADFTSSERDVSGAEELLAIFRSHPWPAERDFQARRVLAGEESCPPGLGIVPDDGRLLHLCPLSNGLVACHYHFVEHNKVAGLFRTSRSRELTNEVPAPAAEELVRRFLIDDHDGLVRELTAARK